MDQGWQQGDNEVAVGGHQGVSYLQVLLFSLDVLGAQGLRVFSG